MRLNIKPLSVNRADKITWNARRKCPTITKTKEFKAYKKHLLFILPKKVEVFEKMTLRLVFGFSSSNSDIDNPVKPFQDILQEKYGFNDKQIFRLEVEKVKTKKGQEFIYFEILNYES